MLKKCYIRLPRVFVLFLVILVVFVSILLNFLHFVFLLEALFIRVNIYWESVNTNRLFCPHLEAIKIVFWANSKFVSVPPVKKLIGKFDLILKWIFKMGITETCIHLHPAQFNLHPTPSASSQLISVSTQLSATPSTVFEPKYFT